ncbi:unnamed protein product [Ixodes pacificus]
MEHGSTVSRTLLSLLQTRVFSSPENMALNGKLHALATRCISHCRRNYGISAVLMQKSLDPVQKLFVDKLREYAQKSKSKSELFVDADEKIKMEYNDELKKAAVQFGGDKGSDMSKFPDFQFEDPQLDPINLEKK